MRSAFIDVVVRLQGENESDSVRQELTALATRRVRNTLGILFCREHGTPVRRVVASLSTAGYHFDVDACCEVLREAARAKLEDEFRSMNAGGEAGGPWPGGAS